MVKIYKQPFAHSGDAIAIPSASQPDGKMSIADGWTPDYQLLKTDPNYKPVGRQEMNGVFKEVTEALGQVQVQGAASWSADGAPYPINAQVYHNGKQWIALRANSVEPAGGADWTELVGKQYVNGQLLGVGQTWQDMTSSRSFGTVFTNSTGRVIQVAINGGTNASGHCSLAVEVDGEVLESVGFSEVSGSNNLVMRASVTAIVPVGSTYKCTGQAGTPLSKWVELR